MRIDRRGFMKMSFGAAAVTAMPLAAAQSYPSRPVRLIVPYAPGGPTDIVARLTAQKLADELGKPFVVENIGGAGGNVGMGRGAKAAPDGHTLLIVPPNVVVNPALYESVPYDPYRDFEPVTIAVSSSVVLSVHPSLGVKSARELVALVQANPGKFAYASPGSGTPPHLVAEQFKLSLRLDLAHAPFNSAGQAVASTLAGHTPIAFTSAPPAVPHIATGKILGLAVASEHRSAALPGVPTMKEAGYPEIGGEGWFAFIVPAGTPSPIVLTLRQSIMKAIALPDVREKISALGFEPVGTTPAESAAQFRAEGEKWAKIIRAAGIKAE